MLFVVQYWSLAWRLLGEREVPGDAAQVGTRVRDEAEDEGHQDERQAQRLAK